MRQFEKIAIIGVGLMGGSLAMAARKKFPGTKLWGYARSDRTYKRLTRLGILDYVEKDLKILVQDADLVVIASPVYSIITYCELIAPFVKKGAIVIDLSSTKELIEKEAKRALNGAAEFVGSHPLCGGEKSGAEFSRPDLYQGSLCLITGSKKSAAAKKVKGFWESLGCDTLFIDSRRHDRILSKVSHLPHAISFALSNFVPSGKVKFAAGSFKDLTRISDSPADVWADILLSNRKNVLADIKKYCAVLEDFSAMLKQCNREKIEEFIRQANSAHQKL